MERRRPTASARRGEHERAEEAQEKAPATATTVPARASTSIIRDRTRSPGPSRPTLRRSSSERTPSPFPSGTLGLEDIQSDDAAGSDASDEEEFEDANTDDGDNQEAFGPEAYDYHNVATDAGYDYEHYYEQQEHSHQQPVHQDPPQQGAQHIDEEQLQPPVTNDGRPLENQPLTWYRTHRCRLIWMGEVCIHLYFLVKVLT